MGQNVARACFCGVRRSCFRLVVKYDELLAGGSRFFRSEQLRLKLLRFHLLAFSNKRLSLSHREDRSLVGKHLVNFLHSWLLRRGHDPCNFIRCFNWSCHKSVCLRSFYDWLWLFHFLFFGHLKSLFP